MTEGEKSDELDALIQDHKKTLAADDPFLAIEARCRSANIPCKWDIAEGFVDGELHLLLIVDMPNGRNVRRRSIYSQEDATSFAASDFESIKILGNYEALYYTDERMIEAALTNLEHQTARYGISAIPGFEFTRRISNFSEQAEDDKNTVDAPERAKRQRIGRGDQWRLCFGSHKDAGWSAEIGSASSRFQRYYTRRRFDTTLRISGGIRAGFHDEALDWLERAANA